MAITAMVAEQRAPGAADEPAEGAPAANAGFRRGLAPWTYDHAELARLELERVIAPSWQVVGHVNAIPKAGDYMTVEIGRASVVALRGQEGEIAAFHNVCRHRAARLVEGAGSCGRLLSCPYHGWSYDLTGALRATPEPASFPGLDRSALGLRPVRFEVLLGLMFVCLAGDPPPLAELWAPFLADLADDRIAEMVPLGPVTLEHWPVDWKVAMDNYLESYHVPVGHPGLFRMFTADYLRQDDLPGGVTRGVGVMREPLSTVWSERAYQKLVVAAADHLPEETRRTWRYFSMLPNHGLDVYPDQIDFFQVLPRGPGQCTIRMQNFGLPGASRAMRLLRYLNGRINLKVGREDEFLCRRVQQGLMSGAYDPGPLSTYEGCITELHDLIRQRIPAAARRAPPAPFA